MADNVLESYLVRLGSQVDTASFAKFNNTLKDSAKTFGDFSLGTVVNFAKIETSLVGMFAAVGTGIISLADKTAMADQQYRLFGLRMMMGKDAARAMSMATDDLGASLDEIAYDPELNQRFQHLYEQEINLGKTLGGNFNSNMIAMRGIRTEAKFFGDELEVLAMGSVSKLFEKLGFGTGDLQHDLENLTDQFMTNIPKWSDEISTRFVPIWNDAATVLKQFGMGVETAAGDFTMLSGVLLGDKSIQSTEFNVHNLAQAIGDWADRLTELALAQTLVAKTGSHYFDAVTNVAGAGLLKLQIEAEQKEEHPNATRIDDLTKRYKEAMSQADGESTKFVDNLHSSLTGQWDGNKDFGDFSSYLARESKAPAQAIAIPDSLKVALANPTFMNLLHGIAMTESSDRQFDINGRVITGQPNATGELALGRYQLLPSTAKRYGIDPNTDAGNTLGGELYLADLLRKHGGDIRSSLAEYGGFKDASPDDYIAKVQKYGFQDYAGPAAPTPVQVNINNITVPPNTPPDEIQRYLHGAISEAINQQATKTNRNVMAQTAAGAYY